jgi:hypothetical protein
MTVHRFWIIGGEFQSLGFDKIVRGTERLIGPFGTRDETSAAPKSIARAAPCASPSCRRTHALPRDAGAFVGHSGAAIAACSLSPQGRGVG